MSTTQRNGTNVLINNKIIDNDWYKNQYPDVEKSGLSPELHFMKYGFFLKRKPSAIFDNKLYDQFKSLDDLVSHLLLTNITVPVLDILPEIVSEKESNENEKKPENYSHDKHPNLKGYFDELTETEFRGWAIDESRINHPVELDIFVDNIFLTTIETIHERRDLIEAGIGGEQAGFKVIFPENIFTKNSIIDIRHRNTDKSLGDSNRVYYTNSESIQFQSRFMDALNGRRIRKVTVIVPIYNAYEAVVDCLDSLTKTINKNHEVLMIDDCSPDDRIADLLKYYEKTHSFRHIKNKENLGYTCTVNKAIQLAGQNDIVLLNSDTVTTPRWLENMIYSAYSRETIATVTAISDNSGAFSVPEIGVFNHQTVGLTKNEHARLITQNTDGKCLSVPTGNGFCLYIRRDFIDLHGAFNEEKYPRGYGEENDLCMRAYQSGWHNLICDKSFVYHKRSQSFKEEKIKLMEDGASQLRKDYPEYKNAINRFIDLELRLFRSKIRGTIENYDQKPILPRALFVISTTTGGTPQTNLDLMQAVDDRYECMLLRCDSRKIYLSKLIEKKLHPVLEIPLSIALEPITHLSDEYDAIVSDLLYKYNIELLHIRHIAWHSLSLPRIAKAMHIPVIYSMHDFYSICPTVNLKNESNKYCAGKCNNNAGDCTIPLWSQGSIINLKNEFIYNWRNKFRTFTSYCDAIISTDESAKEQICMILPEIADKFHTIPHGRDFPVMVKGEHATIPPQKIQVLVLGNISIAKGSLLLKDMIINDTEKKLEFHFLGNTNGLTGFGIHHGTYSRDDVLSKIAEINPHIGVVLSLWPETFCHTLTEMWAAGIPVMAIDLGAVGNRIKSTGAGWLVSENIGHVECVNELINIVNDIHDYNIKVDRVNEWQSTEGMKNTLSLMADRYCSIYSSLQ